MVVKVSGVNLPGKQEYGAIHIVVTRADGTKENRGIVSFSHSNPILNYTLGPLAYFNGWVWERYYRLKGRWKSWRNSNSR